MKDAPEVYCEGCFWEGDVCELIPIGDTGEGDRRCPKCGSPESHTADDKLDADSYDAAVKALVASVYGDRHAE